MPGRPWPEGQLRPCGTAAAYRRHQRRGEPPCHDCRTANRLKAPGVSGYPEGRAARMADYREIRNGIPWKPYIYRGTGYDIYTGEVA